MTPPYKPQSTITTIYPIQTLNPHICVHRHCKYLSTLRNLFSDQTNTLLNYTHFYIMGYSVIQLVERQFSMWLSSENDTMTLRRVSLIVDSRIRRYGWTLLAYGIIGGCNQLRMRRSGISKIIYLVEKCKGMKNLAMSIDTLHQALINSQVGIVIVAAHYGE